MLSWWGCGGGNNGIAIGFGDVGIALLLNDVGIVPGASSKSVLDE
jgi:hypothetical protein